MKLLSGLAPLDAGRAIRGPLWYWRYMPTPQPVSTYWTALLLSSLLPL